MAAHGTVRIVAGGDVYLEHGRNNAPFAALRECLAGADIFFFNLEAPITARSSPVPDRVGAMKMEPGVISQIVDSGVHIVSLAHNHTLDYGVEGLLETLEVLRQHGIPYVGAGVNATEAYGPRLLEVQETRVGFLALTTNFPFDWYKATDRQGGIAGVSVQTFYCPDWQTGKEQPGWPPIIVTKTVVEDLTRVCTEVRKLKHTAEVVLVSCHWGVPGSTEVHGYQREIGHALVEAGADVVIGHHPHVIQGIERYRGGLICYSLANLVFHTASFLVEEAKRKGFDLSAIMGSDSLLLELMVREKRIDSVRVLPLVFDPHESPRPASGEEAKKILARVVSLSKKLAGERFEIEGDTISCKLR